MGVERKRGLFLQQLVTQNAEKRLLGKYYTPAEISIDVMVSGGVG